MIKILHVIDKLSMDGKNPSSCAVLMGDWYESMDHENFEMSVCTLKDPDPAGQYLEDKGISVSYLGYGKISPANISGITRLIDSEKADIVHLHGYSAANFGRVAAKLRKIPNIVHEHAVLKVQPHQYIADKLLSGLTDTAIAVSGNVRDFMIKSRSVPASRVKVIGNGIKLGRFKRLDDTARESKRRELGLPDDSRVLGSITRLREEKGNEYMIRAVALVLEQVQDFTLLIVGDGPLREKLERLVSKLGIEQHVRFLGFRSDVPEFLSLFDIQVIPSLTEGFPLSLAEAMAAGNAVVATEVGGMKEIGRDGETVMFVQPSDPEDIAQKITTLLQDDELARRISNNAFEYSSVFGIEHCVEQLEQEYSRMVGVTRQ